MSDAVSEVEASAAMAPVRDLVTADGGELLFDSTNGSTVTLRLVLDGAECRECVMPREFLEQVALDLMSPAVPALDAVTIIDPREA